MVAKPEFLNHFIFNSDYPTDKIVWLKEGQTTTPSSVGNKTVTFNMANELGSPLSIFVKGAWSNDNWATSYMIGTSRTATSSPQMYIGTYLDWNNNNLRLQIQISNSAATSKTIKYRLWGVVRDDAQQAVEYPKNASVGKAKLIFNTELNYPRLYKDGIAKAGDVIEHNLQKIPYVDFWQSITSSDNQFSKYWIYRNRTGGFGSQNESDCIRATDTTITFMGTGYYYYRIYA